MSSVTRTKRSPVAACAEGWCSGECEPDLGAVLQVSGDVCAGWEVDKVDGVIVRHARLRPGISLRLLPPRRPLPLPGGHGRRGRAD